MRDGGNIAYLDGGIRLPWVALRSVIMDKNLDKKPCTQLCQTSETLRAWSWGWVIKIENSSEVPSISLLKSQKYHE